MARNASNQVGDNPTRRRPHRHPHRYIAGNNNFQCDRCGLWYRSTDQVEDGYKSGLQVCTWCCDEWHPQLDLYAINENIVADNPRPANTGNLPLDSGFSGTSGEGVPGQAVSGTNWTFYLPMTGGIWQQSGNPGK